MSGGGTHVTARRTVAWCRTWRSTRAVFALPVALASGCLLVAPPEDFPAPVAAGHGGSGGSSLGGTGAIAAGGVGAMSADAGTGGGELGGEGGRETSGGTGGSATGGAGTGGQGGTGGRGGASPRGGSGGTEPAGGEGGMFECTTNAECVTRAASDPARCRTSDHRCVTLKTNECPVAYAGTDVSRFSDPNAIYVGSFAVLNPDDPGDSDVVWAEELAIDEINAQAGGLPGGPGGAPRPLVLVICNNDTTTEPNLIETAMQHLTDEVEVPAVLAMLRPEDLDTAFDEGYGKKIAYLNPVAILRQRAENTKGLIWTLLGQPSDYAPAYGLFLSELETYIHTQRSLADGDTIKVALVNTTDAFNDELQVFAFQDLSFNHQSAAVQAFDAQHPDGKYLSITLDLTSPNVQGAADQIVAFAPDVIISTAGDPMTEQNGVLEKVEDGWPSTFTRPYYILSPYNATTDSFTNLGAVMVKAINGGETNAPSRFIGISAAAAATPDLQNAYASRFLGLHKNTPASAADNTGNYYDAVYYLAYSIYAAPADMGLTGPGISAGMKRLIDSNAMPFDDGPKSIASVYTALDTASTIALNGTLGPPDFDPQTGVRPATPSVYCFNAVPILHPEIDVLRYDPTENEFIGDYPCLPNFPQ